MIVFFENNVLIFIKKLRNYRNEKEEIKRIMRNYRTLK